MRRAILSVLAAVAAVSASVLVAAPAQAATNVHTDHLSVVRMPVSAAAGPATACPILAYGYLGNYLCSSNPYRVLWGTTDETFVIAPNRAIYHAWAGSGGWKQMPGGGLADDVVTAYWVGNDRLVVVWVRGIGDYCTYDPAGSAGWNGWQRCYLTP